VSSIKELAYSNAECGINMKQRNEGHLPYLLTRVKFGTASQFEPSKASSSGKNDEGVLEFRVENLKLDG